MSSKRKAWAGMDVLYTYRSSKKRKSSKHFGNNIQVLSDLQKKVRHAICDKWGVQGQNCSPSKAV